MAMGAIYDRRKAFTLVELLVVIAIIGVLVALLLPAVQSARSAARRMSCRNNFKNLALGVLNYESANGAFPSGFVIQEQSEESWGWTTFTLPYIEQQALYDNLGVADRRLADLFKAAAGNLGSPEIAWVQTPLSIFRCPEDDTPELLPADIEEARQSYPTIPAGTFGRHFDGNNTPAGFEPSTSNYIGVKGMFDNQWCHPDQNREEWCENNGVLFGNSEIGIQDITDGTSNTFLIGERHFRGLSGTWIGARNPPGPDMWSSYYVVGRCNLKLNLAATGRHNTVTEGFSSNHQGGAHFAMCDGSVHFISDDISFNNARNFKEYRAGRNEIMNAEDLGAYQRLASRDDGTNVSIGND